MKTLDEILNQWLKMGPLFMLATLFGLAMIVSMLWTALELLWKWCRKKLADICGNKD